MIQKFYPIFFSQFWKNRLVKITALISVAGLILSTWANLAVADDSLLSPLVPDDENSAVTEHLTPQEKIDLLIDNAMKKGLIAGGVVLIGNSQKNLFEKAYGRVAPDTKSRQTTIDTIYDLASLTKVIATTPAILKLVEEKKISLTDPVEKWFPEFVGKDKKELLVKHLLTHTSGLHDVSLSSGDPMKSAIEKAADQKLSEAPGDHFKYAD
ncbi:MAG: beta-lactamase family protein, partial [Desulfuromonadales bacterium]|nr:beta-lactamase family protein [Desulfuromonadales bacterium]